MKYLTFWKGPISIISKMPIFQEFLLFSEILASKIKKRDILSIEIGLKIELRPPAKQNLAFFSFRDVEKIKKMANFALRGV